MTRTTWLLSAFVTIAAFAWWMTLPGSTPTRAVSTPRLEFRVRQAAHEPLTLSEASESALAPAAVVNDAPAEASDTCKVRLRVRTHRRDGRAKGDLCDVLFEFGMSATKDASGDIFQVVEFDDTDLVIIDVPWDAVPKPNERGKVHTWLRASGPGILTLTGFGTGPRIPGQTTFVLVDVLQGMTVEGRIVDERGRPVAGRVDAWSIKDKRTVASEPSKPDGRFSLNVQRPGRHRVLARGSSEKPLECVSNDNSALDLGSGVSETFDVRFDTKPPFIEVTVSGLGVIRGRIVDATGKPAEGLWVAIDRADIVDANDEERHRLTADARLEGGGHTSSGVFTDATGAFEARGLKLGSYHLAVTYDARFRRDPPQRITTSPVVADGAATEFEFTRPHLAVHVQDPGDGSSWHTQVDNGLGSPSEPSYRLGRWPEEPYLYLSYPSEYMPHARLRTPQIGTQRMAPGKFLAELDASGVEVDVGVIGGGVRWTPQRVHVPAGAGRTDVNIELQPAPPHGTLVLDARDENQRPIHEALRVRAVDPATGIVLINRTFNMTNASSWPTEISLPAGDYTVVVEGHPWYRGRHGTPTLRRKWGLAEHAVRIKAHTRHNITATMNAPAYLNVRLLATPNEDDLEASRRPLHHTAEAIVKRDASCARLFLAKDGHWREPVRFAWGKTVETRLRAGRFTRSEGASPGSYTLIARMPGGRTRSQHVDLTAGETTSVVVDFER